LAVSKSPDAFRTISEVAEAIDVPQHVLRFWESKFSQIKPLKRGGGRRYYRPEDVDLLRGVRTLLYSDGYTVKGVQKVFREQGARYVIEAGRSADSPVTLRRSASAPFDADTNDDFAEDEFTDDAPQPHFAARHNNGVRNGTGNERERNDAHEVEYPSESDARNGVVARLSPSSRSRLAEILRELEELRAEIDDALEEAPIAKVAARSAAR
jgi:DNA-binding transcriptional MerR regulator